MKEYLIIAFLLAKFLIACFSFITCMAGIMLLIIEIDKAFR